MPLQYKAATSNVQAGRHSHLACLLLMLCGASFVKHGIWSPMPCKSKSKCCQAWLMWCISCQAWQLVNNAMQILSSKAAFSTLQFNRGDHLSSIRIHALLAERLLAVQKTPKGGPATAPPSMIELQNQTSPPQSLTDALQLKPAPPGANDGPLPAAAQQPAEPTKPGIATQKGSEGICLALSLHADLTIVC